MALDEFVVEFFLLVLVKIIVFGWLVIKVVRNRVPRPGIVTSLNLCILQLSLIVSLCMWYEQGETKMIYDNGVKVQVSAPLWFQWFITTPLSVWALTCVAGTIQTWLQLWMCSLDACMILCGYAAMLAYTIDGFWIFFISGMLFFIMLCGFIITKAVPNSGLLRTTYLQGCFIMVITWMLFPAVILAERFGFLSHAQSVIAYETLNLISKVLFIVFSTKLCDHALGIDAASSYQSTLLPNVPLQPGGFQNSDFVMSSKDSQRKNFSAINQDTMKIQHTSPAMKNKVIETSTHPSHHHHHHHHQSSSLVQKRNTTYKEQSVQCPTSSEPSSISVKAPGVVDDSYY